MLSLVDLGPPPPCPVPFNAAAHVLAHAQRLGDKPALELLTAGGAEVLRYRDLQDQVLRTAGGLKALGLATGSRILLRLDNSTDFPVAFLAALAADMVPMPTAAGLTGVEVDRLMQAVRPDLILHAPGLSLPDELPCPVLDRAALRALRAAPRAAPILGDPERLGFVLFTSGSSGAPRPVAHAHRALWGRRLIQQGWLGLSESDRVLHAGAFNWSYTLGVGLLDPWSRGATALVPGQGAEAGVPGLLEQYGATIFAAVPGVYRRILKHDRKFFLPALRHALSAGERLSAGLRTRWEDATGVPLIEALGMSECSTFVSGMPGHLPPVGHAGYVQPGRCVAILGEDHSPVRRGEIGQLAVRHDDPGLFLGYLDQPEATARHFAGQWFLTSDLCRMAGDGAIAHVGRADSVLTSGGFRVSPAEIESVFADIDGVSECAAIDVALSADTRIIALAWAGAMIDLAVLQGHADRVLAPYKRPRLFVHLSGLPVGGNGKLDRTALRSNIEKSHGQA